jgi:hypothetical protein
MRGGKYVSTRPLLSAVTETTPPGRPGRRGDLFTGEKGAMDRLALGGGWPMVLRRRRIGERPSRPPREALHSDRGPKEIRRPKTHGSGPGSEPRTRRTGQAQLIPPLCPKGMWGPSLSYPSKEGTGAGPKKGFSGSKLLRSVAAGDPPRRKGFGNVKKPPSFRVLTPTRSER